MKINNLNDIRSFYQKFLLFEDPVGKWLHILKSASQSHSADFLLSLKNSQLSHNNFDHEDSARLVNVLLAYAEAKCFESDVLQRLKELHLEEYLPARRVEYWRNMSQVDLYMAQWLTLAETYWPDWTKLTERDVRIEFLSTCRQALEADLTEWQELIKVFEQCLSLYRVRLPVDFLPRALILVEGVTEQFLLPFFACNYGLNLAANGIMIVPAGGANKIVRKYYYWKERVKLPIFCLFDADAFNLANSLAPDIRASDNVYTLLDGEIEDLMQLDFLIHRINDYLAEDPLYDKTKSVSVADFNTGEKRTLVLDKIWRKRELGKFEKVKFAQFLANQSYSKEYDFLSDGGKDMLDKIANVCMSKS